MQQQTSETAERTVQDAQDGIELVMTKLQLWVDGAVAMLPNLVVALVVLLVAWAIGKLVGRLVRKAVEKTASSLTLARFLGRVASLAVLATGLFFALGVLHLDKTVTSLLAGAGVVGLALAFAFQDMAANFMAGVYMSIRRPISIGQVIETNDVFGTVQQIDMRSTVLRTPQGQIVRIPNRLVFEDKLTNHSESGERRVDLVVGVGYEEKLERVRQVAVEALSDLESRDQSKPVELFFTEFGGSSINFVARYWTSFSRQADYRKALDEGIVAIHEAFGEADINIPFPIRTLDFGASGGTALREELVAARGSGEGRSGNA